MRDFNLFILWKLVNCRNRAWNYNLHFFRQTCDARWLQRGCCPLRLWSCLYSLYRTWQWQWWHTILSKRKSYLKFLKVRTVFYGGFFLNLFIYLFIFILCRELLQTLKHSRAIKLGNIVKTEKLVFLANHPDKSLSP